MDMFDKIAVEDNIKNMVFRIYEADIDIDGGWGYTQDDATIINSTDVDLKQLQFNLAHMRVYLEMNIKRPKEDRFGGIDILETGRYDDGNLEKVKYKVSAIPEKLYNGFIDEYKENYGRDDFNLSEHFARRKDATLTREIEYWFNVSNIL